MLREAPTGTRLLPAWGGALVLLGYAVVLLTLGAVTVVRRDVA